MSIDKSSLDQLRIERPAEEVRRTKGWIALAVILLFAAVLGWALARPKAVVVQVSEARAVAGGADDAVLNATGYVTARRQATVSSKVTGKVMEVLVEEGMKVNAGQVLARLDTSTAEKGLRLAQAERSAAASALDETRVRIAQAKIDYRRVAQLSTEQISSASDREHAEADMRALEARLANQADSLAVSERQVALQQQNLDDTVIRAPFDGVVVTKDAQPGEMISPISAGSGFTRTGICTVVDMDSLEVDVDVGEAYIHRVRPGQRAVAALDAYPDWKIPAHVITAIPTADRQKATVKVRVAFDAKDPRILPDMGVKVAFLEEGSNTAKASAVEVPRAALRRDGEQDVLFVIESDHVERRAVKVGDSANEVVRVSSGVAPGERVVTAGPADLRDGQRVKIKENAK